MADEGTSAKSGQAAAEGLLKQGVLALTGVASSSVMLAIRDVVEQARVPLIGSNASPTSLQSVVYIWRTSYVLDEAGRALGRYLKDELGRSDRVAMILPEAAVGAEDVLRGFRQEFGESDPRIADPVTWTSNSTSPSKTAYASDIDQALRRNPDGGLLLLLRHGGGRVRHAAARRRIPRAPSTRPAFSPRARCWRASDRRATRWASARC